MGGATLLFLHHDFSAVFDERDDLLAFVADHGDKTLDSSLLGGVEHPVDEWLAQHLVGDLGFI